MASILQQMEAMTKLQAALGDEPQVGSQMDIGATMDFSACCETKDSTDNHSISDEDDYSEDMDSDMDSESEDESVSSEDDGRDCREMISQDGLGSHGIIRKHSHVLSQRPCDKEPRSIDIQQQMQAMNQLQAMMANAHQTIGGHQGGKWGVEANDVVSSNKITEADCVALELNHSISDSESVGSDTLGTVSNDEVEDSPSVEAKQPNLANPANQRSMQQQIQAMDMLNAMMAVNASQAQPTDNESLGTSPINHHPISDSEDEDDSETVSDYDSESDEESDDDEQNGCDAKMQLDARYLGSEYQQKNMASEQDDTGDYMEESDGEDSDDETFSNDLTGSELDDMTGDGSSWCSDESESDEYDDLMADLMGVGTPRRPTLPPKPTQPLVTEGLLPIANADDGMNPMDGLAMLQSIRSELEQVGRMIVTQKTGEKFLQRAHILASINWLATNVPSCVLDHLGQEIREGMKANECPLQENAAAPMQRRGSVVSGFDLQFEDDGSAASDLSDAVMVYDDDADDDISLAYPVDKPSMNHNESCLSLELKVPTKGVMKRSVSFGLSEDYSPSRGSSKAFSGPMSLFTSSITNASKETDLSMTTRVLPSVSHFECALLFVDISGFTQLSTMLDPENLSKVINNYFELITKTVFDYEGDIQKFAGDALFAEWRVTDSRPKAYCVDLAAHCAAHLVKACADFPVMAFGDIVDVARGNGTPVTHLNVHCGLGIGSMAGIHIGDSRNRREYVYLGDPIRQATSSCNEATFGQAMASKQFINELAELEMLEPTARDTGVLAYRSTNHLKMTSHSFHRNANSRGVTEHVDGLEVEALIEYRRLMSLYVHPVVVSNDVAAADGFKSSRSRASSKEAAHEESELRSVYVMFIKPVVSMKLTGNSAEDKAAARLLNNIMLLTTRELNKYHGHLRQTILDDKV